MTEIKNKLTLKEIIKYEIFKKYGLFDLIEKKFLFYTKNIDENILLLEELEKKSLFKRNIVYSMFVFEIILFFYYIYLLKKEGLWELMLSYNIILTIVLFSPILFYNYKTHMSKTTNYIKFKNKIKKEIFDINVSDNYLGITNKDYYLFKKACEDIYSKRRIKEENIEDYIINYISRHKT